MLAEVEETLDQIQFYIQAGSRMNVFKKIWRSRYCGWIGAGIAIGGMLISCILPAPFNWLYVASTSIGIVLVIKGWWMYMNR